MLTASDVVTVGSCNFVAGMASEVSWPSFGPNLAIELEKLYVSLLVWSVGGVLDIEDRSVDSLPIDLRYSVLLV